MSPERKLEAYLVKRCKELDLMIRKVRWIGRNGAPDRVIFGYGGQFVWVELKGLRGKRFEVQDREQQRMVDRGQNVQLAKTVEDVERIIDSLLPTRVPSPDHSSDPQ